MNTKKTKISSLLDDPKNTGSSEVQIGFLTNKIRILSDHFKNYKKDKHSSVGLVKAINKRKRLLNYLKKTNEKSYSNILEKLNLRK
jgi:small subunit ribosomal protein S15|tara:strand:+ start:1194 stop:1451 length:258 start_codon:yes stop_codon:yes gene_type:complete